MKEINGRPFTFHFDETTKQQVNNAQTNLDVKLLLSLGMDRPNINLACKRLLLEDLKKVLALHLSIWEHVLCTQQIVLLENWSKSSKKL